MTSFQEARTFIMNMSLPPDQLRSDLLLADISGELLTASGVDELPLITGAYTLILHLKAPAILKRPRTAHQPLAPGWYIYAGSARGPGGIRARLARHFRTDKRHHWHIDQLTSAIDVQLWAIAKPDGHECDLVRQLNKTKLFHTACVGFGSSDCRRCEAHLLKWTHQQLS